jgi:hypothetical protein
MKLLILLAITVTKINDSKYVDVHISTVRPEDRSGKAVPVLN